MVSQSRYGIDWSLPQSKMTPTSWGGEHSLSGPRNWLEIPSITVSQSSKPSAERKTKEQKFPGTLFGRLGSTKLDTT